MKGKMEQFLKKKALGIFSMHAWFSKLGFYANTLLKLEFYAILNVQAK